MARKPRATAQAAAASLRTPTPHIPEASDEDIANLPGSGADTPQEEMEEDEDEDQDGGGEATSTPAQASEPPSEPSTPAPSQPLGLRKRRLGRPPKNKPPDWDTVDDQVGEGGSEAGTPQKKRRGRPPATGGGRWKPKGGPSHVTQVPIDKEGNMMDVIDDEVALPEDPEGEAKVDKMGYLQGERDYRVRTFTILGRGDRLYMLSTEPARCIGFRDSYLFFTKHKQLYKIIIDEPAKRDLIDREIIPHSYKGRAIGVVTARSVFREFGASIVIGGRKVIDDYQVQAGKTRGDVEGEIAEPNDKLPSPGESYNKNQYVAWHGASSVYHTGAPSVPLPNGKVMDGKKRKVVVTGVNWMFEHAREASRFNTSLAAARRRNLDGAYDPHTNIMQYPAITQPTHARWEQVPLETATTRLPTSSGHQSNGIIVNGSSNPSDNSLPQSGSPEDQNRESIFPPVARVYSRNLMVADTCFTTPPMSGLGAPGPHVEDYEDGFDGLTDVPQDVIRELPSECRKAFDEAKEQEWTWKHSWRTEMTDGVRGTLRIGF
ncbi:MAG: hypothetical protein M1827_002817 [Pycnora praestabilis]|nr:MAG: hypothetical protein M1827_002817 [Pycnora praestabilis]